MARKKAKTENLCFTCSNPKCKRAFTNPIIVHTLSLENQASYHACPYCLTGIEVSKTEDTGQEQAAKKTDIEQAKGQPTKTKLAQQSPSEEHKCPHHFGYLSQRSKEKDIPEECITCEKIVECMLSTLKNPKQ